MYEVRLVERYSMTDAHVVDDSTLKSFFTDDRGNSYLVHTDLVSGSVSDPTAIQPIKGEVL